MNAINLLPPEKKDKLKERQSLFRLKNVGYIFMVFILITLGMLYAEKFYLDNKYKILQNEIKQTELTLPSGETLSLNATIKDVNGKIKFLEGIQNNYIIWSSYIKDLVKLIPEGVSLSQFSITQESGDIQIDGKASLRDDFLKFKSNLENSEIITELNSPISNLIKRENIAFTLSGKIVSDNYKLNQ